MFIEGVFLDLIDFKENFRKELYKRHQCFFCFVGIFSLTIDLIRNQLVQMGSFLGARQNWG